MYDVTALGELLIDFTCTSLDVDGYPIMQAHPGGAPANYLAALSKFGAKTAMLGKVGGDVFGELLINTLRSVGVSTEGMVRTDKFFTTLAFVTLDENGEREFSFSRKPGADTRLCVDEVRYDIIDESRVFHFGTLSMTDEPAREATYRAVEYAAERGKLISFDPNLRKPLWHSLDDARREMLWGLAHADVVKISDEEVEFLFGLSPMDGAGHILDNFPVKLVFVTCGADGCFYKTAAVTGHIGGIAGVKTVDTTGAGDIFGGSAMFALLKTGKDPAALSDDELADIVRFACTSAGLSTAKPGGISSVPDYAEVIERKIPTTELDKSTEREVYTDKALKGDC